MTQTEFDKLIEHVAKECAEDFFREMYAREHPDFYVRVRFVLHCEAIITQRKPVALPVAESVQEVLDDMIVSIDLEDSSDKTETAEPYSLNFALT